VKGTDCRVDMLACSFICSPPISGAKTEELQSYSCK